MERVKYIGVSLTHGHWQAQIRVNGRLIYLGLFCSSELAAEAYDLIAIKYRGTKAKLNFTNRSATVRQEQIYRLCSPDHHNLTYEQAGLLLGISDSTVCRELQRMKKKCPSLFPFWIPQRGQKPNSYQPWMDFMAKERF